MDLISRYGVVGGNDDGIVISGGSSYITIRNNTLISSFWISPIRTNWLPDISTYITIEGNIIDDSASTTAREQISISNTHNSIFRYNQVLNSKGAGLLAITQKDESSDNQIYGNIFQIQTWRLFRCQRP